MNFSNILVPVKGSPCDQAAVRLACQIAKQGKAKVLAIHVIEIQRNLPLNAENDVQIQQGEAVLEHTEQIAHAAKGVIETELLQARVAGAALIDEATERNVDLIVMGVPYRKPLNEFVLGATTQYLLKNAACPVWFCREAMPDTKQDSRKK